MRNKLQTLLNLFLDRFTIQNKIIVSCLPFILLSYLMIFLSIVMMMFSQSKTIVYEQTEQNIIEKASLINTTLKNYDLLMEKFLYYSPEMQHYLTTYQKNLSPEVSRELRDYISKRTASMITDNMPGIMSVMLFNQYDELYINNAIYAGTLHSATKLKELLYPAASSSHGKMLIASNTYKPSFLTLARNAYIPELTRSDEETGFLMLDIQKSEFRKLMNLTQNQDAIYVLLLDNNGTLLVNGSEQSDESCLELLSKPLPKHYRFKSTLLDYGDCRLVTIVNEKILFQDIYHTLMLEIAIIILSVLLILTAVIFTGNTISGQVKGFIQKLTLTNKIDKNAYIQITSKDEFQELSVVYNDMLSRINHLSDTVYLKEILAKDAQLKSLQAQINPHFLYNTLDCINGLIELGRKEEARKTVTALANIMRMSIKGDAFLSIGDELKYLEQYIYIQKVRFQDRILFLTEIPASLHHYYIPKLIIQPLLENSIIHGVSDLTETGMIGIFGREEHGKIYISVKDNGVGISPEILSQLETPEQDSASIPSSENPSWTEGDSCHIGLWNIKKRLQLIYGSSYGLSVSPVSPSGSCVTICIPTLSY